MTAGAELLQWSGEAAAWISMVGEAALRGTLLLLAAFLMSLALRHSSAASRHLVWASCLCLLLLLPVLAQITPTVPAPVIPQTWSAAWNEVVDIASSRIAGLMAGNDPSAHPAATALVTGPLGRDDAGALASATVQFDVVLVEAKPGWGAATWMAAIWAAGTSLVLCWLAVGLWLRASLSRRAHIVHEGPWVDAARSIAAQLGIKRDLVLLRGKEDAVPMTWGALRPVIYLPPGSDDWASDQRRSVLLHELAHVRRWDSLTRSVSQLACAIFWFHPLAWYAAHRLLREQERACDDIVLLAGAEPDAYATTLLTLARHYRRRRLAVVGALALTRRSKLENRLISILDPRRKRLTMSRTHRFLLLATLVAVVIPLASLQPAPAEPAVASAQSTAATGSSDAVTTTTSVSETTASDQAAATTSGQATAVSTTSEETAPVQMIIKGVVHFGGTLDEIEVGPGGRFVIQEIQSLDDHLEIDSADPGKGRRLEITADSDGNTERTWTVDGATRGIDDDARSWIDGILGRLDDAHVEFTPFASEETRTLIFAGESLAMVGEAHTSAGASSHGVLAFSDGDEVIHVKPGVVWTTEEGDQSTVDIHLSELHINDEGGAWTIHLSHPDIELLEEEAGKGLVIELKKVEGGKNYAIISPELEVVGEGDERTVVIVVPKEGHDEERISAVLVNPKVKIIEEAGEPHAVVVIEPRIVAEAQEKPFVHVEVVMKPHVVKEPHVVVDVRTEGHSEHTITMDIDDEDSHMTVRMRGEVDLANLVEEIEVGEEGELSIDERDADGVVRQISIHQGSDGNLIFKFFIDGAERPFDEAARAWLQGVLDRIEH